MSFVFPGSPAQVAVGFTVCLLFLILASRLNPYVDHRLERMQIWALFALTMTLFYGMILMIQETAVRPLHDGWMSVLSTIFFVMNWSVLFYPIFQIYFRSRYSPGAILKRTVRKYVQHVEAQREEHPDSALVRAHDTLRKSASFKRDGNNNANARGAGAPLLAEAAHVQLEAPPHTRGVATEAVKGPPVQRPTPSTDDVLGAPQEQEPKCTLAVDPYTPASSAVLDTGESVHAHASGPIPGYTEFGRDDSSSDDHTAYIPTPQPEPFDLQIAQMYYQIISPPTGIEVPYDPVHGTVAQSAPGPRRAVAVYAAALSGDQSTESGSDSPFSQAFPPRNPPSSALGAGLQLHQDLLVADYAVAPTYSGTMSHVGNGATAPLDPTTGMVHGWA
mmetsp:Transcript_29729/g.60388  ORF Transcript_29729/g.60388 Transcript_29729/m.60388 type:complete len:389 (-) Transcript_29729:150-1316(-)